MNGDLDPMESEGPNQEGGEEDDEDDDNLFNWWLYEKSILNASYSQIFRLSKRKCVSCKKLQLSL